MKTILAILLSLFSLAAEAAYQSVDIVKDVKIKNLNRDVVGRKIHWEVIDDFYPKPAATAENPNPQSPINGVAMIKGANYTAFQAANAAGKKALLWSIIAPDIKHFYRQQSQQPVQVEEEDMSSPVKGQLTTQAP